MSELLPNFVSGRWATGSGAGTPLSDPVLGDELVRVHDTEVFGPVATPMPYRDEAHALALLRRGQGSLVASLYGSDANALAATALELAGSHGRVHIVTPDVAALQASTTVLAALAQP